MTKSRWLLAVILTGFALLTAVPMAMADEEDYYWKNSYPRGVGTIPPKHECTDGKVENAGLCYDDCRAGYHGVGPLCLQNDESYGRGVGTIPPRQGCGTGKEKDAGLCYTACRAGYHGVGPVCWRDGAPSYARGVGTPLVSICGAGKEADAGLCYTTCKADFTGIGPVCWGDTPKGYVDCGAGFAKDSKTCATTTASQVASVAMFVGAVVAPEIKAALAARKAASAAKDIEAAGKILTVLKKLQPKVEKIFAPLKRGAGEIKSVMTEIKTFWKEIPEAQKLELKLAIKVVKTGVAIDGEINPIDMLRYAADIASVVDPSPGLLSLVASYCFPVYGVDYT